jgi:hypothetical protein
VSGTLCGRLRGLFAGGGPGVAEVAGDACVWAGSRAECGAGDAAEALLEEEGAGDAGGEGEGCVAEFGFGVEEDGFVDEALGEEGAVELGAGLDEEAEDLAVG